MTFSFKFRLYLFTFIIIASFVIILYQLWNIQIIQKDKWTNKMLQSSKINIRVPGIRGEIKDRNGITLATNEPSFEVVLNLEEIIDFYNKHLKRFNKTKKKRLDIVHIVNEVVMKKLANLGLDESYNYNQLKIHYKTHSTLVPFVYRRNLTFEEFARYAEHSIDLPGLEVRAKPSRKYIYGSLACHILGYMALFDDQRIDKKEYKKYKHYVGDDFGIQGVEKTLNHILTAEPGQRIMEKDEKGDIVKELKYIPPKKGKDVFLTIDAKIQYITEKALRAVGQGAAVVIQPKTGAILAMASVPSYDPNLFIPTIEADDWNKIKNDKTDPLLNKAILAYAPGSTFKIPTSIAGCYKYKYYPYSNTEYCSGSTRFGNKTISCWIKNMYGGSHKTLNMVEAIKRSCNCFF